jgi:tetratricopeptide (TPR) repeat protein
MEQFERATETSDRRLDSWKEIAAFFDRDQRTVRRWEKERDLPVHRMPGKTGGSVYAFSDELSLWLKKTPNSEDARVEEAPQADAEAQPIDTTPAERAPFAIRILKSWLPGVALLAVLGVLGFWFFHSRASSRGSVARTVPARGSAIPEANDFYLKGRYEWSKRSPESLNKAVDYFTQAIVRDPTYAQAYAGLADTYNLLREFSTMPEKEAYPRAITAARKAVELDDSLSEAHRALAFGSFWWTWDFASAEREFKRALELSPNDAVAHHWYATSLMALARFPEALSQIERARQLDPSSVSILADKALILFYAQHGEEAISLLRQIEAADPGFFETHRYRAYIALLSEDYPTYLAEAEKAAELNHDQAQLEIITVAGKGFSSGGGKALLLNVKKMQEKYYAQGRVSGWELARTCALSGENREALKYLETDFRKHDTGILAILCDPAFRRLAGDPAYRNLVARLGLPSS